MRAFVIIITLVINSISVNSQSIVNGGSGQGLVNLVPDNGFEFKNGFKNIRPDANLGFWRLRIIPERLSTGLQEIKVVFEFSVDKPIKIRGYNASGGEVLYNPSDFQAIISGSMDFMIEGQYTDPTTGKHYVFNFKKYVSKLGNSTINGSLFTYGPEIVSAIGKLKIAQEANPLAAFLNKFKVQVTSIKAVSRNYRGFKDLDYKIGKMLEKGRKETENKAQADSYLRQGHVQYGIKDYQGAKELYQKAYAVNKDPKTLALVEDAGKAIANKAEQERLQKEEIERQAAEKSNNVPSLSGSSPVLTSSTSPSTQASKNTVSSQKTSKSNNTSNSSYRKEEKSSKTYEQMLYEREAYQRQQRERIQNAVDPTRQAMQPVRNYFDAQIDRINREAAAKEAREEREWLARKRREEREARERERRAEEYRRKKEAEQKENREKRLAAYQAKGGDVNYRQKLNQWRSFAANEVKQINTFINRYRGQGVTFTFPENNCHYVQAIENIQNSTMPNEYKDILIRNVLKVRLEYYLFFVDNGYVSENWKAGKDDIHFDEKYAPCGNYLDAIASSLTVYKVEGGYDRTTSGYGIYYNRDIGGMDTRYVENDALNIHSERNYHVPVGAHPIAASFKNEVREAGITMHERQLRNASNITLTFHKKIFDWSKGATFRERKYSYTDGLHYESKGLAGKPDLIKAEIDKIKDFHDLKREFRLNSVEDERNMMYFTYHAGDKESAYNHFLRYVELKYGSWQLMMQALRKDDLEDLSSTTDQPVTVVAFATLLMDNEQYGNALEMVNILHDITKKLQAKDKDKARAVSRAAVSLHNKIAYRMQKYDEMFLPKDEAEIKDYHKKNATFFKFIPRAVKGGDAAKRHARSYNTVEPIRHKIGRIRYLVNDDVHLKAAALIKLGRLKEAKVLAMPLLKYYSNTKDKRYDGAPRFYGDETDINAMKEVVAALDDGKQNVYQYIPSSRLLLMKEDWYGDNKWSSFLQWWYIGKLTPVNPKTVDLANSEEWKQIKSNLNKHDGSRQAIKGLYGQMADLYKNARLEPNDETRNFLIGYIQMGTALARFNDIIPAIAEKQRLFPEVKPMVEENLALLMWEQVETLPKYKNKYDDKLKKLVQVYHPARNYFEKEVKNSDELKRFLETYLSIWSRDKVSSPIIPYLYSLYPN